MSSLLEFLIDALRRTGGVRKFDPTDPDLEFGPIIGELKERGLLPENIERLGPEEQRQAIEEIPDEELRDVAMVDFQTFMSVGLEKCGNDPRTFSQLTDLWNREKDEIQKMTRSTLRQELRCP